MSVRYYDEALLNKIRSWVLDPNMRVLGTRDTKQLFSMVADQTNDRPITLPLITISRNSSVDIYETRKAPRSLDGKMVGANAQQALSLTAIDIGLKYAIDIYTRYDDEGDEYMRNFVYKLINKPNLEITIPYNGYNHKHMSHLRLLSPVEDNSDVPQKFIHDQFSRWTLNIEIDNAHLFGAPVSQNWSISEPQVNTQNNKEGEK